LILWIPQRLGLSARKNLEGAKKMKHFKNSFVSLTLVALVCLGCGNGGESHSSPQAVFEAMNKYSNAKDYDGMLKCFTPGSQDLMVGGMAIAAAMAKQMGAMFGKADPEMDALVKKHGIATVDMKEMQGGDPGAMMKKLAASIKDKGGFMKEFIELMEKKDKNKSADFNKAFDGKLGDVKIDGDKATGKLVVTKDGKETKSDIQFRKIKGSWLVEIDMGAMKGGKQ
jgi:hypothetical protein